MASIADERAHDAARVFATASRISVSTVQPGERGQAGSHPQPGSVRLTVRPSGHVCPVAPLRCLECRHALILPSNLPQSCCCCRITCSGCATSLPPTTSRRCGGKAPRTWRLSWPNAATPSHVGPSADRARRSRTAPSPGRAHGVRPVSRHPLRPPGASARFGDDEAVIQPHPLPPDATPPRFGDTGIWDLNGVVERPANQSAANYRVLFTGLRAPIRFGCGVFASR